LSTFLSNILIFKFMILGFDDFKAVIPLFL
jgi:hypothetical protein